MATFVINDSMFWTLIALGFGAIIVGSYIWIGLVVTLAKKHLWVYKLETILVLLFPMGVVWGMMALLIPLGMSS